MSEKTQALLDAALALDPEERRRLAEALWDDLAYDNEGIQIAEDRLEQLKRGDAKLVPFEESMRLLGR